MHLVYEFVWLVFEIVSRFVQFSYFWSSSCARFLFGLQLNKFRRPLCFLNCFYFITVLHPFKKFSVFNSCTYLMIYWVITDHSIFIIFFTFYFWCSIKVWATNNYNTKLSNCFSISCFQEKRIFFLKYFIFS